MHESSLTVRPPSGETIELTVVEVHTLVVGSGAAGLCAAVRLVEEGIDDLVVVTEGLEMGTSINTGSDKQTYYKLSLCGHDADAPELMAQNYFDGGGMHGDLALVEASVSPRAFAHLVNLGVPFPRDTYGQFLGSKTDHDPRQRATSIGPYTSREMCRALIRRLQILDIPVHSGRHVVELITVPEDGRPRAAGAIAWEADGRPVAYLSENVVFAVGGPGGLYRTSVYPEVHTGAIGLALRAGAAGRNLPESQYGLASTRFRWNVSGTFMQVIPKFISVDPEGKEPPREFLRESFDSVGAMCSAVFLKGYQWPFDSRKVIGGSSIVDILVYIETVLRGRRVMLDFRENPQGFLPEDLSDEARGYLEKSKADQPTPIERLRHMNPGAIELYAENGIDLSSEPLEVAVCAQHNNGGLSGDRWWQSESIARLFPIGEVNGSHGVYRPGGSALNSGQVGAFRAAEYIAQRCRRTTLDGEAVRKVIRREAESLLDWLERCCSAEVDWRRHREQFQARMSESGAHIRDPETIDAAVDDAWGQVGRIEEEGCRFDEEEGPVGALQNRHLVVAHAVYLEAIRYWMKSGVGSRGSAMVLDPEGKPVHPKLDARWRMVPENEAFRLEVLETQLKKQEERFQVDHRWVPRRELPRPELWFETDWARFREGTIYDDPS